MTDTSTTARVPGRFGRSRPSHQPELHLARFRAEAPKPPDSGDVTAGITAWGMLGNGPDPDNPPEFPDGAGDCGPAATEHYRMAKAGSTHVTPPATTQYTLGLYVAYGLAMGEPGPYPDQGVANADWLGWLFDQGIIEAYAELDASDADEVHQAMLDFRGVLVGCSLTDDAQSDFASDPPVPWTITAQDQPDPRLGHDVLLVAYGPEGEKVVTWGGLQPCTVAWESGEALAGDLEAWVIVTAEDAERAGVDLGALRAEIRRLRGVEAPEPPAVAPPVPTDPPAPSPPPSELRRLQEDVVDVAEEAGREAVHVVEEAFEEVEDALGALQADPERRAGAPLDDRGRPRGVPYSD